MNQLRTIFLRKPIVWIYLGLYCLLLGSLGLWAGMNVIEPLMVLLILGGGFSLLAWLVSRHTVADRIIVRQPRGESAMLAAYLGVLVVFLTWGMPWLKNLTHNPREKALLILGAKLVVCVLGPLLLWKALWGYRLSDFTSPSARWRVHLPSLLWVSTALISFQLVFGKGLAEIRGARFASWQLALGVPVAYLWLVLEAGIVEEFFFRALLQSRLAALMHSETAAILIASTIFGLAHAPGLYLRTAATGEALGPSPSLLMAVGYSIVVVSVPGIFLGILWSRTKSLTSLVLIHAAGDLVPNVTEITRLWLS